MNLPLDQSYFKESQWGAAIYFPLRFRFSAWNNIIDSYNCISTAWSLYKRGPVSLIPDTVIGTEEASECYDAAGLECRLLLHLCGIVGGHPAPSQFKEKMNHMASSACTHCILGRKSSNASTYDYIKAVHYRDTSNWRYINEPAALHISNLTKEDTVILERKASRFEKSEIYRGGHCLTWVGSATNHNIWLPRTWADH